MFIRRPPQGGGRRAKGRQSSSSSGYDNGERSKHHRHKRTRDRGGGNGDGHRHHKHRSPRRQSVAEVHATERRRDKPIGGRDEEQSDTGTSRSRRGSRVDASTKLNAKQADGGEQPGLKTTGRRQTGLGSSPTKSKAEPAGQKAGYGERQTKGKATRKRNTTVGSGRSAPKTKATREPGVDSDSSSNVKTAGKAKRGEVRNATKREVKHTAVSKSTATTKKKPALLEAPKKITVVCDPNNGEYVEYVQEVHELFSDLGLPTHLCTEDGFIQINKSLQGFHSDRYLAGKKKDEQPSEIEQEAKRDTFRKFEGIRQRIKVLRKNEKDMLDNHGVLVRNGILDMFEKGEEKAKLAREDHENELRNNGEREAIAKRMEEYDAGIKEKAKGCISAAMRKAERKRVEELERTADASEFNSSHQSDASSMNGYEDASAAYGHYEYAESSENTESSEDSDEYDEEETTTYKYIPLQLENGAGTSGSMGGRAPRPSMNDWETMKKLERESPATAEYYKRQLMGQRGISHF